LSATVAGLAKGADTDILRSLAFGGAPVCLIRLVPLAA
jgi:hypothetical protein